MSSKPDKWFVEEFHLRSPIEEFEDHVRFELEQIRKSLNPNVGLHQQAADLVIAHLRGERQEASS